MNAKALILAAGAGTRMKSAKPKVAHEMLGKPLLRWVVDAVRDAGCSEIHTVIGTGKEVVEPMLPDCVISYQLEMLGTGHTVMCAADKFEGFSGCILVLCGDAPLVRPRTLQELVADHEDTGAACTILTMEPRDANGYGRIVRDEKNPEQILAIVEQKDCTQQQVEICECNSGIYCFDASALLERLPRLSRENAQGEYYLTDIVGLMVEDGLKVEGLVVEDETECMGVNCRSQLALATQVAQYRINEKWMAQGVSMLDPSTVWIGPDVKLSCDCEILPLTMLWGNTCVGKSCTLGPNTRLTNCNIGNNCILDETVAIDCLLEDDVTCGPRAYLRPGTHMCKASKAGTSVEIKNSVIGDGSKVPHLSYIGDTKMGNDVNIGAGTITCNYDGVNKNKTVIGDNSFIGSSTMLVAPVTLGKDVITGAASAIVKNVPDGALALERSDQKIIEGWAKKHK